MEGFFVLSVLSFAMFAGSYLAGSVPLAMSFSEAKLRLVTVFGAGLLVGTALSVIIPEGVQAIYEAEADVHNHQFHGGGQLQHKETLHILEHVKLAAEQSGGQLPPANPTRRPQPLADDDAAAAHKRRKRHAPAAAAAAAADAQQGGGGVTAAAARSYLNVDVHSVIGLALVVGFVFMLAIDQLSHGRMAPDATAGVVQPRYKVTATVGLVVHAAADGIALGAASTTAHSDIQMVVFLAIMLHKAPAAFGLVVFLLHESVEKARVRRHLLVFSLAAPLLAVATYFGVHHLGGAQLSSLRSTGVLMLFSAGTFLYVATVHVLPEIVAARPSTHLPLPTSDAAVPPHAHHSHGGFKLNELVALVVGAFLPTVLTLGHHH